MQAPPHMDGKRQRKAALTRSYVAFLWRGAHFLTSAEKREWIRPKKRSQPRRPRIMNSIRASDKFYGA